MSLFGQPGLTRLQVLAMAHNLSIGTICKKIWWWKTWQKRAKNCLKEHKKCYNLHTSRELVSPVCLSPSCLKTDWCLQGTASNSDEQFSCRQFQINLRAIFPETRCGRSGLWYTSLEPLSRNSWMAKEDFFITTNFQTVVRGAQGPEFPKNVHFYHGQVSAV